MKIVYFIFLGLCLISSGCGLRQREEALEKKENEINQKEQRLLLREKELQLKEEELAQRQRVMDSTQNQFLTNDSAVINPQIIGNWSVTMRCTATTCEGSAIGDTKNETWQIYYQDQNVIIKAFADNKLVRTYTGVHTDRNIQLVAQQDETMPQAKMTVQLNLKTANEMDGTREIVRANNCQIVYALTLRKS